MFPGLEGVVQGLRVRVYPRRTGGLSTPNVSERAMPKSEGRKLAFGGCGSSRIWWVGGGESSGGGSDEGGGA
jgi:hypothetical protein